MYRRKRQKKPAIILTVVFIILLAGALIAYVGLGSGSEDDEAKVQDTGQAVQPGSDELQAVFGKTLASQADYDVFVTDKAGDELLTINPLPDDFDWDSYDAVPVEFAVAAGRTLEDVIVGDDGSITLAILGAPKKCFYPSVQVRHLGFAEVPQGTSLSDAKVSFTYQENDAECPAGRSIE